MPWLRKKQDNLQQTEMESLAEYLVIFLKCQVSDVYIYLNLCRIIFLAFLCKILLFFFRDLIQQILFLLRSPSDQALATQSYYQGQFIWWGTSEDQCLLSIFFPIVSFPYLMFLPVVHVRAFFKKSLVGGGHTSPQKYFELLSLWLDFLTKYLLRNQSQRSEVCWEKIITFIWTWLFC